MTVIFANRALLPEGWRKDVHVHVDSGRISKVVPEAERNADCKVDTLLPAVSNLHSHTFQRAMAGRTERRGTASDSFWTWREEMYRFAAVLKPEDIEAIAAFAFMEMLEQGYAACAEFHYLHHQQGGIVYASIAEMSACIFAAAERSGIGLTLLPVHYAQAGIRGEPLSPRQGRFGNSIDRFMKLHAESARYLRGLSHDQAIGVAAHSLRAVSSNDLKEMVKQFPSGPFHIHVAEQEKEVADVQATYGARPVEWLLSEFDVTDRWCLVHATHMTDSETANLARRNAIAGLCPITEANLGDGVFPGNKFLQSAGRFGIGTDSNIQISLAGELRMLEYSQRLATRERNVLSMGSGSTGEHIYAMAAKGGAQALGRKCGEIALGHWADLTAINSQDIALAGLSEGQLLDGWIFAANQNVVTDVWSAGRHCVQDGVHLHREKIERAYRKTLAAIAAQL